VAICDCGLERSDARSRRRSRERKAERRVRARRFRWGRSGARRRSAVAARIGLDWPAMSGWKARAARIARAEKSWAGAVRTAFCGSLQELRTHLQRLDQDAAGASAQEGALARSRQSDDRGQEAGEDRGALQRSSDDGLPLAASVSPRPGKRQAANAGEEWSKRMKLSSSNPSRADGPSCRKRGGKARHSGLHQTTSPSSSPATRGARPSMRSCFRSTALQ